MGAFGRFEKVVWSGPQALLDGGEGASVVARLCLPCTPCRHGRGWVRWAFGK